MHENHEDQDSDADDQPISVNGGFSSRSSSRMSCRHLLAFVAFLGFVNVYCLRVNLSVALVAMVNQTAKAVGSNVSIECPVEEDNSTVKRGGEMNWDSNKQAQVLAAFFYGYIGTQVHRK